MDFISFSMVIFFVFFLFGVFVSFRDFFGFFSFRFFCSGEVGGRDWGEARVLEVKVEFGVRGVREEDGILKFRVFEF